MSPEAAADDRAIPLNPGAETAALRQDKIAYDPSADEDELVITDPFAENEPGFSLAPDEPPVTLGDHGENENLQITREPAEEMAAAAETPAESAKEEMELDFKTMGSMTIDADPQLTPASPKRSRRQTVSWRGKERLARMLPGPWRAAPMSSKSRRKKFRSPAYKPGATEKPSARQGHVQGIQRKRTGFLRKSSFARKPLLMIALPLAAVLALWLVLSGKFNSSGGEAPTVNPAAVARPAVRKRPPAARKLPPAAPAANSVEMDKAFDEKFQQANELYKKGEILKAWAVVLEAKKIKMTEPLRLLEEQLALKIRADEAQARQESQVVQSQWELESQAFAKAETGNTLADWQNFLKAYPQGEFANRAEKKVAGFEKKIQENSDQQLQLKILQAQKVKLRSSYLSLGQADITAIMSQGGKTPSQLEVHEHGGAKVMLDYAAGLMWSMWNKPMDYSKAKWWANRVTAGYGGWRLPTAEEALSLLRMDRAQYSGLAGFAVWTGDTVSDQPRSVWVLRLPEGQFAVAGYEQIYYVWAVRKAGK